MDLGQPVRAREAPGTRGAGVLAFLLLALATIVPPIAFRLLQANFAEVALGPADFRGGLADLGIALLLASLLTLVRAGLGRRAGAAVGLGFLAIWVVSNAANLEHVRNLGTPLGAANAGFLLDGTFVTGSATHFSHPFALAATLGACAVLYLIAIRHRFDVHRGLALALIGGAVLGVRAIFPVAPDAAGWRQTHFVVENLRWMQDTEVASAEAHPIPGLFPAGLEGSPRLALDHRGENVLLVVLEGVSGAYLERLAALHRLEGERPDLPALDRMMDRGITLANFVNQQRQTNRGLYALVCGDLPKQTTASPKMSEIGALGEATECLPRALGRNGYQTAFLQSAPLSFMGKDRFMPEAGFDRFHGVEFFSEEKEKLSWGVDDHAFFDESLRLIDELEGGEAPWFLTLLTSGTHHPFHVPPSFLEAGETPTFSRAIEYLDGALDAFVTNLESRGLLEDTIVLITSDESFGLDERTGRGGDDGLMLSQAWGVLVALLPSGEVERIDTPYSQTDVAVSILDLLGLQHESPSYRGRSFFRRYDRPRVLPFANTYMRMSALVEEEGTLLFCQEDRSRCERARLEHPPLVFAGHRRSEASVEATDPNITLLGDLQARSFALPTLSGRRDASAGIDYELVATPTTMLLDAKTFEKGFADKRERRARKGMATTVEDAFQPAFGNQYLALPANHRVRIELEVEAKGRVPVVVRHSLRAVPRDDMPSADDYREGAAIGAQMRGLTNTLGFRPRFVDRTQTLALTERILEPNDPLTLVYEYSTKEDLERLNARLGARNDREGIAGLVIRRAQLFTRPLEPGEVASGLEIVEYSHRETAHASRVTTP